MLESVYYVYIAMYTYVFGDKKIESYFSDRLPFTNICCGTSRQINRLVSPLSTPETLSSLSKSSMSLFNAHLALFIRRVTQV